MRIWVALMFVVACGEKHAPPPKPQAARPSSDAGSPKWMTDPHVLRDTVNAINAHIMVLKESTFPEYRDVLTVVDKTPGVVAAEPFSIAECVATSDRRTALSVAVKGVDPARVGKVLSIGPHLTAGSLDALAQGDAILVGDVFAAKAGLHVGDEIPIGCSAAPRMFRVAGTFHFDFDEWDDRLAIAPMAAVQVLTGNGDIAMGVELVVQDPEATEPVVKALEAQLQGYVVTDWRRLNREVIEAAEAGRARMQ